MMASSSICCHCGTCTAARLEVLRQVEQVLDLARRQAGLAQRRRVERQHRGRRQRACAARPASAAKRSHTDCAAFTEICWPTIERASVVKASPRLCSRRLAELRDQLLHHAVAPRQVLAGLVPVVGRDARGGRRGHGVAGPGQAFTQVVPCGESFSTTPCAGQLVADAVGRGEVACLLGRPRARRCACDARPRRASLPPCR